MMNHDTLLILKSAEHWLDNYYLAGLGMRINTGADNCPLCRAYLWDPESECGDCPIALDTGRNDCYDTPYYAVIDARNNVRSTPNYRELLLSAIADEYTYLVDLAFRHHEANPEPIECKS